MSEQELVRYEVRDRVAEITMRREPVNAINLALTQQINAAYVRARDDDQVRAIILTSDCQAAFSAGMDLEMIRGGTGQDLHRFLSELYFTMHDLQYRMGKPTIAAMTGPARAAGVTLAVSCDILIATDQGDMSYPEIDVGVIPAMHYVHLPQQIGRHKAFELLFGGDTISYVEAAHRGLINHAVPHGQVLAKARKMAAKFAKKKFTRGYEIGPGQLHARQRRRLPPRHRECGGDHLQYHRHRGCPERSERLRRKMPAEFVAA